jgi:hypothetical protein
MIVDSNRNRPMKKPPCYSMSQPDYVPLPGCRSRIARVRIDGPTISISGRQILLGLASI